MKLGDIAKSVVRPKLHKSFEDIKKINPFDDSDREITDYEEVENEQHSVSGLALVIEYENAKGEQSQRLISCKKLSLRANKHYLQAYCHQCESHRTFRLDRIVGVFDSATGECLNPVQAFFDQFALDEMAKSGLSWGLPVAVRADLIAFLNALIFVARCDQEYHPLEREALETAIIGFWLRREISGDPDIEAIIKFADKLAPDGETFWIALHRIREIQPLVTHFKRCAGDIIHADGIVHKLEGYWAVEIEQFFG